MGAYEITDGPAVDEMTLTPTSEGGLDYTDVPYDEQVSNSLKDRIGRTKVYLLEDEAVWGRKVRVLPLYALPNLRLRGNETGTTKTNLRTTTRTCQHRTCGVTLCSSLAHLSEHSRHRFYLVTPRNGVYSLWASNGSTTRRVCMCLSGRSKR